MNAENNEKQSLTPLPAEETEGTAQPAAKDPEPSLQQQPPPSAISPESEQDPAVADDGGGYMHPDLSASLSASLAYAQHGLPKDKEHSGREKESGEACNDNRSPEKISEVAANEPPKQCPDRDKTAAVEKTTQEEKNAVAATEEVENEEEEEEEETEESDLGRPMSLRDHLNELRKRVVRAFFWAVAGFIICYPFAEELFSILFKPLTKVLPSGGRLIYTSPPEAFFTYMKVAFVAGLFLGSPMIFYQIWVFVAPGLYKEEKIYILPIAFFSSLFFICGGLFCYFVTFPFAFDFFMSYSTGAIVAMPGLSETLSFVLQLLLAFGLIFELPLFVFFLSRLGIITADMMRKTRRYAILVNFIAAAILTPPDVMSQLLMAGPLILLYEISILIAVIFGKKKAVAAAQEEDDEEEEEEDEEEEKEENLSASDSKSDTTVSK